jgi:hypothetical protein
LTIPSTLPARDAFGGLVLRRLVKRSPGRKDLEEHHLPGVEVGLRGWHRAHSMGNITGNESRHGIRYAPPEVNLVYMLGVERYIREMFQEKAADVEILMTTVTYSHPGTLRLKEIQYRIDAVRADIATRLLEVSIHVQDRRDNPRVWTELEFHLAVECWPEFLSA